MALSYSTQVLYASPNKWFHKTRHCFHNNSTVNTKLSALSFIHELSPDKSKSSDKQHIKT